MTMFAFDYSCFRPVPQPFVIDYPAAVAHCYKTLGHPGGTKGCVAFARGAEWARDQIIARLAAQPQPTCAAVLAALLQRANAIWNRTRLSTR